MHKYKYVSIFVFPKVQNMGQINSCKNDLPFLFINLMFNVLEKIAFTTQNGLVFCNKPQDAEIVEILLLDDARKLGASAALFRRYYRENEENPYKSEPSVYIFQKENITDQKLLHAKIWSAGKVEVYIVLDKTNITIFNARRPAEVKEDNLFLDNLRLANNTLQEFNDQRFAAHLFGTGTFWEQGEMQANLQEKYNPYIHLLNYLMLVRAKLSEKKKETSLQAKTLDKILVLSILAKFLEEIKDDNEKHTLKEIYHTHNVSSFEDALRNGKTVAILSDLAQKLNGKIFEIDDEIEQEIKGKPLPLIADFLTGEIEIGTRQGFLWKQYDFKYLPAEIISAIYENFIQAENVREKGETEKGVVYTPIHLVHLLIDELMPLDKAKEYFENESFKVLDPTCGSGVFLVAAYKRMLQWWAMNHSTKENIQYPQAKVAQSIMEQNIFGVDVQATAILVSIFGLTTALLEKLTPKQIWNDFQFNDLSKNIQKQNFFEWAVDASQDFDLVIGNPPFNVPKGESKTDILAKVPQLNIKHKDIPNKNFALHFFEVAMSLSKKVGMIIPSNVLLYSKDSQTYRNQIFTDFTIEKIYDFTHLRRDLFHKTADTPVVAIIAENKPSQQNNIEHIVVKKINSTENKTRFEIDHYDRHVVAWNWAIDETKQFIWKCNLLGGGRLFHLIYRLSLVRCLNDIIQPNWKFNIGYIVGNENQTKTAEYITGNDYIISINEKGEIETAIEQSNTFEATRTKESFTPPFIVFKDVFTEKGIPNFLIKTYKKQNLLYRRNFTGLSVPKTDIVRLENIYQVLNTHSKLFLLYILSRSASALVKQETYINKEDMEELPFPQNEEYLNLSSSEKIIQDDVLNHYIHLGKSLNKGGAELYKKADNDLLADYGKAFCELINPIHAENDMLWQIGEVYKTPDEGFIAYQFVFGKEKESSPFEIRISNRKELYKEFEILTTNVAENRGVVYERIIRWYGNTDEYDYVVFIKPNAKRYWLKSIALRDADETVWDYFKEGY